jgi:predicted GTPase
VILRPTFSENESSSESLDAGLEQDVATVSERALVEAVAQALRSGSQEFERLAVIVAEAESRLREAGQLLEASERGGSESEDGFFVLLDGVVSDLKDRLNESRRVASTFNIVFFGRTGAGKSTLLSALGRLNGELVSDGRSDFTTDVQPLDWQGCRLYDTPGINGWGRTRSRPDLEESAREAVEVADVVLLCFDSQSQQASEFRKVAEWVRAYRKPVIAVLNMRNAMWRHPALGSTAAHRNGLAQTAQQHADNIRGELNAIGLPGVPVVAISSQRALFARASTPFVGPAAAGLAAERLKYGLEYLDRWSNLPVLEQLISACVVEGAGDLRLAALREGFQARLRESADQVDFVADQQQQRGVAIEGTVATWLDVLGYPDPTQDGMELLSQLEAARDEPFTAPFSGRLEGQVRHLLKSHLYPHRTRSLRAAEDLILDAFDTKRRITNTEFESRVFDAKSLAKSNASVAEQANEFLSANLDLASDDARIDIDLINRSISDIQGNAGWQRRGFANALRALGTLGTAISVALPIFAATNLWNPAGWVAAAAVAGLAFGSWLLTYSGRWTRRGAEKQRVASRSKAVADARVAVNAYYEECETRQLKNILTTSWVCALPWLKDLLETALHTRNGCAALSAEATWFRGQADVLPPSPSPADVIRHATERTLSQTNGWDPPTLNALLLGEDWVFDMTQGVQPEQLSERDRQRFESAATLDRAEFSSHLAEACAATRASSTRQWLEFAGTSQVLDQRAHDELNACLALLNAPPNVVILGDYSSGKTSLIKRMLAEAGAPTPTSLHVEAGPATSAVQTYEFGQMVLVDCPGFQSGHDHHDELALQALQDAALVIVVLHVNLLIGDTSRLRQLLLGDETRVGRAARTLFVIGRIDEIGADPRGGASDFLARRQRKLEELLTILESQGLAVDPRQVLALSADPYELVGDRAPVASADYDSANRVWDGVSTLCQPLLELDNARLADLSAGASLDRARSALLSAQHRFTLDCAEIERSQAFTQQLEQLLTTSHAELRLLKGSIEQRIRHVIDDHATEVLDEALGAAPAEAEATAEQLRSWWEDPRLASAMESLEGEVERDITDWLKRHSSQFDRELRRFEFAMNRDGFSEPSNDAVGGAVRGGIHVAAGVLKNAHGIGKALGNRDAVYAIGKAMGAKFKPWGAVKLGAKVGKAAAVLGVVSLAFDIAEFVNDQKQEQSREQARKAAVEHVRATAETVAADLLSQAGGPMEYIQQLDSEVTDGLEQLRVQSALQQQSALEATQRLDGVALLRKAGDELAESPRERVIT